MVIPAASDCPKCGAMLLTYGRAMICTRCPYCGPRLEAVSPEAEPDPVPPSSTRILVAEDGRTTRQVLSFLLANRGFEVIEAEDGRTALERVRALRPDLVLLDADLPEVSGYDVYRELKHDPAFRKVPVLLLVANTDSFSLPTRTIPPAEFLISKPFSAHDLLRRVAKALNGRARLPEADLSPAKASDHRSMPSAE